MNNEHLYLKLLELTISKGELVPNRTGVSAYTLPYGTSLTFDLSDGFPLLTTKKMAWKSIRVELEFFIRGLTDKRWLQERDCKIWNQWCRPTAIPLDIEDEDKRKEFQKQHNDLGPIYGYQWRDFNSASSKKYNSRADQLYYIVERLKTHPTDRQLVCSAWNPLQIDEQALPPCHLAWHVFTVNDKLNLTWYQRSCDAFLGIPFNIASYATLLHLLCKETNFKEGSVTGFFSNFHVYENHIDAVKEQIKRKPLPFPEIYTDNFSSIFDWEYNQTDVKGYNYYDSIKAPIAV